MPLIECGFSSSAELLAHGPVLTVKVGFDPLFNAGRIPDFLSTELFLALVDTGASESCIDSVLADRLALPFVGTKKFAGSGGTKLHDMHLAQVYIEDLGVSLHGQFAAIPLAAEGQIYQVLLGRDFLQKFRMVYDGRTGKVVIENWTSTPPIPPAPDSST